MATVQNKTREAELYEEIYKNTKMGAESTIDMMKDLTDGALKTELGRELAEYEKLADEAKTALLNMNEMPKEENIMSRMAAKMGVKMNTLVDPTPSHIAEMVIKGCAMGTSDLTKKINQCEREANNTAVKDALALARRTVEFEEDCAQRMKAYL